MVGLNVRAIPDEDGNPRATGLALAALSVVLARTVSDAALGLDVREAALAEALEMLGS